MKYMIVHWDNELNQWIILHYSHKISDVKEWYTKFKRTYPSCRLMVDYHEAKASESKESVLRIFEDFLNDLF